MVTRQKDYYILFRPGRLRKNVPSDIAGIKRLQYKSYDFNGKNSLGAQLVELLSTFHQDQLEIEEEPHLRPALETRADSPASPIEGPRASGHNASTTTREEASCKLAVW
jgi:hypothetical protein